MSPEVGLLPVIDDFRDALQSSPCVFLAGRRSRLLALTIRPD